MYMMFGKTAIVTLVFILFAGVVTGHGNVLYAVDLSFEEGLQEGVTATAKQFFSTDEEPYEFDFERELIFVKFDSSYTKGVYVHPVDFSLRGFRNDELVASSGNEIMDAAGRKDKAQILFDGLPESYKSQLKYGGEKKVYAGTYRHVWYRHVDNVLVFNELFEVEIEARTGEVVSWKQSIFQFPKEALLTNPAFSGAIAEQIALLDMNAEELDFEPVLVIEKNKLHWIVKVKKLYPRFVAIDAIEGDLLYAGPTRGELPADYSYGLEAPIEETETMRKILAGEFS